MKTVIKKNKLAHIVEYFSLIKTFPKQVSNASDSHGPQTVTQ